MRVEPHDRINALIREKIEIESLPTLCEDTGRLGIYKPGKLITVWTVSSVLENCLFFKPHHQ